MCSKVSSPRPFKVSRLSLDSHEATAQRSQLSSYSSQKKPQQSPPLEGEGEIRQHLSGYEKRLTVEPSQSKTKMKRCRHGFLSRSGFQPLFRFNFVVSITRLEAASTSAIQVARSFSIPATSPASSSSLLVELRGRAPVHYFKRTSCQPTSGIYRLNPGLDQEV